MASDAGRDNEQRVIVVPPTRRDGVVTARLLSETGIDCVVRQDVLSLEADLKDGIGAIILTDAALAAPHFERVAAALARQPSWSDLPIVLLTPGAPYPAAAERALGALTNVTLLDRPVSIRTLISAILAALRARARQYQIRDQLQALRVAEDALREADRHKDEFLATLAHELRNPLAPIRIGLQILSRSPEGAPHAMRARETMERQLRLLIRLIDDLLDVSRISSGKINLRRERIDLRTVVSAALEDAQAAIDAAGHRLTVQLPSAPLWLYGDGSRLAQVVSNLLNNATKYTPRGGQITVAVARDGDDALVRVSDSGAGIPPDMLAGVFDMFAQVNRTLDRAQGGLGIGLSLVRRLVELHGGTIVAESAGLDQGSTFTLRLPANDPQAPLPALPEPFRDKPRRLRVMIVDDNADAAESLALLLDIDGHQVRTELSGSAALAAAAEFMPDVVFCDLGLPGVSGHDVAASVRSDPRFAATTLVALTGWGSDEDRRRARDAGFDFHLTKPASAAAIDQILLQI